MAEIAENIKTPDKIDLILERLQNLESDFSRYQTIRSECAKYSWPAVQDMVKVTTDQATGSQVRTVDIYDATPRRSSNKMATGIFANMYPAGVRWIELKASNDEPSEDEALKEWLSKATDITLKEILRSNFQNEKISKIRSKIVFGDGTISVQMSKKEDKLVFKTYHVSNIVYDENCDGMIDTVFRKILWTARQVRQKFPKADLGKTIEDALKKGDNRTKFEIIHAVYPREDYDPEKTLSKESKRFVSIYINRADKKIIEEENGYDDMPYIVGRLDVIPDELVGIGLVAEMLPDIKMTNSMCKTFAESSEKQGNPPIILEDDGVVGQPNVSPGGVIYKRSGADDPKPMQTGVNSALNAEIIRQYKMDIEEGFSMSLFDVLRGLRNMTASEVVQRTNDSLTLLSAFVSSEQQDMDLLIERVVNLLIEAKKIPAPPVKDFGYDIVYRGRLSMAMNAVQAVAIEQFLAKWSPYNELSPVMDNFDLDEAAKTSAYAEGVPAKLIRRKSDVDADRQARQERKEKAEALAMADAASKAYKNASVTAQPNSMASAMMGA